MCIPDDARGSGRTNRTRSRSVRFSEGRACDARDARRTKPRSAWPHRPPCVFPHRPRGDRQRGRNGGSMCAWCSRSSRVLPPSSAHSSNCRSPRASTKRGTFPSQIVRASYDEWSQRGVMVRGVRRWTPQRGDAMRVRRCVRPTLSPRRLCCSTVASRKCVFSLVLEFSQHNDRCDLSTTSNAFGTRRAQNIETPSAAHDVACAAP